LNVPVGTRATGGLNVLATVTFNPNQLRAYLLPILSIEEVERVTLVSDRMPPQLPKLHGVVPPKWLVRIAGRAGAKLILCIVIGLRDRPDWVIGFNFVPHGFNALVAARLAGTRSLYHMIGGHREWTGGGFDSDNSVLGRLPRRISALERLLLFLIGRCTLVATMGEVGRRTLIERGLPPDRVIVMPPSVDTARFSPIAGNGARRYDILSVAALLEVKRPGDILEAVGRLQTRGHSIRAALAGDGPLAPELRRIASEANLNGAVEFLGFRDDVDTLYSTSKVFVLASRHEGLPGAMLEAMACGVPPLVPSVGEIGSFVRNGETGAVFPSGDVTALTDWLDALITDPELRERLGRAAAEDARTRVSVEAVASLYRRIFGLSLDPPSSMTNDGSEAAR
jgi:glycosyltransferase involved in cell wall biosynthesis